MKKVLAITLVLALVWFISEKPWQGSTSTKSDIVTCDGCGGTGKCLGCGGNGVSSKPRNNNSSGVCKSCDGTGKHRSCSGTGRISAKLQAQNQAEALAALAKYNTTQKYNTTTQRTCQRCNGTGHTSYKCSSCGGTGINSSYELISSNPVLAPFASKTCPACNGSGYRICTGCGGKGLTD